MSRVLNVSRHVVIRPSVCRRVIFIYRPQILGNDVRWVGLPDHHVHIKHAVPKSHGEVPVQWDLSHESEMGTIQQHSFEAVLPSKPSINLTITQ